MKIERKKRERWRERGKVTSNKDDTTPPEIVIIDFSYLIHVVRPVDAQPQPLIFQVGFMRKKQNLKKIMHSLLNHKPENLI